MDFIIYWLKQEALHFITSGIIGMTAWLILRKKTKYAFLWGMLAAMMMHLFADIMLWF